jgi:DNA polymerase-1
LQAVLWALDETTAAGLDLETTGLDPRADRIRLLSLATDRGTWLVDTSAVDPRPLFEFLAEKTLIGHNLAFDLSFLAALGFEPGRCRCRDTMLLSQLLYAGQRLKHGLDLCCGRELGQIVDKTLQTSDWSGPLTAEQLDYAAADVDVLRPLCQALDAKIAAAGLDLAAAIEMRCLPALVWLAGAGAPLDAEAWADLARHSEAEAEALAFQLDALAPDREGRLPGSSGWNWNSPKQAKAALRLAGCEVSRTRDEDLAAAGHPLADLLRRYRTAKKRACAYGLKWLRHVGPGGRVYARWHQLGAAASGRMSCAGPNLQNVPQGLHRSCVQAPAGRVLVKADFSQIELRIAAKLAGESNMLDAFRQGLDLHVLTARRLLGKDDVTKEDRKVAKSANFGLLYGMGKARYQTYARTKYGISLTLDEAAGYRRAFFATYPGLGDWHRSVGRQGDGAIETRTLTGRRRLDVDRFAEKLNTPVQGSGADGLKVALALLWERRAEMPGAFPVLVVHDEIVIECDEGQADPACAWLRRAMLDGMAPLLDPVPVEVETTIARSWGGD